ncbi:MAG: hypothetical protein ABSC21_22770 [Terriglobia bacterium]
MARKAGLGNTLHANYAHGWFASHSAAACKPGRVYITTKRFAVHSTRRKSKGTGAANLVRMA